MTPQPCDLEWPIMKLLKRERWQQMAVLMVRLGKRRHRPASIEKKAKETGPHRNRRGRAEE